MNRPRRSSPTPPFVAHILELMRPMRNISARAMFGGHGIYKDGKMFAIVVDDELYFKVTELNRASFVEREMKPFAYERQGRSVALSYYTAPAECLDHERTMLEWSEPAYRAAISN